MFTAYHLSRLLPHQLPAWQELGQVFDGLLTCLSQAPTNDLGEVTDWHRELAGCLLCVGAVLWKVGLNKTPTEWEASGGSEGLAKALLEEGVGETDPALDHPPEYHAMVPGHLAMLLRLRHDAAGRFPFVNVCQHVAQFAKALLDAVRPLDVAVEPSAPPAPAPSTPPPAPQSALPPRVPASARDTLTAAVRQERLVLDTLRNAPATGTDWNTGIFRLRELWRSELPDVDLPQLPDAKTYVEAQAVVDVFLRAVEAAGGTPPAMPQFVGGAAPAGGWPNKVEQPVSDQLDRFADPTRCPDPECNAPVPELYWLQTRYACRACGRGSYTPA